MSMHNKARRDVVAEPRKGRQTPTQSAVLPYLQTKGQEAIELYNSTGRKAQPWQELLLADILAYNDDGLWTHTRFGYSVPRRNGKNEIVAIREAYGLVNGERILHTAHRTTTSSSASKRLANILNGMGYTEVIRVKQGETYNLNDKSKMVYHSTGITNNVCVGNFFHDTQYWNGKNALEREAFAHFFEAVARADVEKIEIVKGIFPEAYKTFEGMLEILAL